MSFWNDTVGDGSGNLVNLPPMRIMDGALKLLEEHAQNSGLSPLPECSPLLRTAALANWNILAATQLKPSDMARLKDERAKAIEAFKRNHTKDGLDEINRLEGEWKRAQLQRMAEFLNDYIDVSFTPQLPKQDMDWRITIAALASIFQAIADLYLAMSGDNLVRRLTDSVNAQTGKKQ